MNKKKFDFFQDHSLQYLAMVHRSDRQSIMELPEGYGKRTGGCGDTVEIFLQIREDTIRHLSFLTNGCINTMACCNTVAQLAEGGSVEQAWGITPENVVDYLETLPADHVHCAELAVGALYLALSNFQEINRAPWKKLYQ